MTKQPLPFGSWPSPIAPELITQSSPQQTEPRCDAQQSDNNLYWIESRPKERGRNTIVKWVDGQTIDVVPAPINVRTTINEYGGGHYCVNAGVVYFVVHDDQQIYRIDTHARRFIPEQITNQIDSRFADLRYDHVRKRLIAIREVMADGREPVASLVSVELRTDGLGNVNELVAGADFYSSPTLSPDGQHIAWISWSHPNMPWDTSEAWLASVDEEGYFDSLKQIGGDTDESFCQPSWSPGGELFVVSDRNNWWNLYRYDGNCLQVICPQEAEFAYPPWVYGLSNYCFVGNDTLLASYTQHGLWKLARISVTQGTLTPIDNDSSDISDVVPTSEGAVFIGGNSEGVKHLISYSPDTGCKPLLHATSPRSISGDYLSPPQPITFTSTNGRKAYGFYYPPTSKDYRGTPNELPPLLVFCHGGPTAAASSVLNLKIQFWTSRGFAVADVNYSGSTGYGRSFRQQLHKGWGETDVEDIIACADYLVDQQLADPNRLAIRGSSAGGYSVLAALTFHDRFKAGASLYGISDLETLASDTHKFESRYMDSLIGPYPESQTIYKSRSPIHHVEKLNCPVIFLQGLKDKVVPPQQAETMVNALAKQGIPHAYVTFPEEAHGFRQADNIHRALLAELSFYRQVFNIEGSEPNDKPVDIKTGKMMEHE